MPLPSSQSHYNIAISISNKIDVNHLYSNGISQNIILLYELFELLGHQVFLVTDAPKKNQKLALNNNQLFRICTLN